MKKLFLTLLVASFLFAGCVTDFEDFVKNELEIPATKMWVENSTQQVHYVFSVVDATNYHAIRRMLVEMDKRNLHKLVLHMDNGGGSMYHMCMLLDLIKEYQTKGFIFIAHNEGLVGSAAVPLFMICDERWGSEFDYILIHPHSGQKSDVFEGNINKLFDEWTERYAKLLVKAGVKYSVKEIIEMMTGDYRYKAWILNFETCMDKGFYTHTT